MIKDFLHKYKSELIQCFRLLLAVAIALYISLWIDLYKPMWTIIGALFLQMRPEAGFVIEKAICLMIATFIGLAIGFTIIVFFVPYPLLAILSLVIFLIICSFISAGMNHPNFTYGIALGNITAIIVVFYSVNDPQNITATGVFNVGMGRFTEIGLGAIIACLTSFLVQPHSVRNIYKKHSGQVFLATIKHLNILTNNLTTNNFDVNIATREIIETIVDLHNDSSADLYETLNKKNNYILFSNRALSMLKYIKDYSRNKENTIDKNFINYSNTLNNHLKEISLDTDLKINIKNLRLALKDCSQPK